MRLLSNGNRPTVEMYFMPVNVCIVSGVSVDDAFELVKGSYFTHGEPNAKMFL